MAHVFQTLPWKAKFQGNAIIHPVKAFPLKIFGLDIIICGWYYVSHVVHWLFYCVCYPCQVDMVHEPDAHMDQLTILKSKVV